jgi:hypothetical protein
MAWYNYIVMQFNKSFDKSTTAINTLDYPHHEIHSGSSYTFSLVTTAAQGGGTQVTRFVTDDTAKWTHMLATFLSDQPFTVTLYEDTTFLANGTGGASFNRNRNSDKTSSLTISYGATIDAAGTQLYQARTGARGVGSSIRSDNEWLLKQNTAYAVELTNHGTSAAANLSIALNYYQHTDRNI